MIDKIIDIIQTLINIGLLILGCIIAAHYARNEAHKWFNDDKRK